MISAIGSALGIRGSLFLTARLNVSVAGATPVVSCGDRVEMPEVPFSSLFRKLSRLSQYF
jgi:hypothetical protein